MSISSVVIVGAGQAGFQVAASLRQGGYTGALTLIGDEPGLPYQRPPLSKAYLLGKIKADNLAFRPATFLSEQNIELLHTRAVEIDRQNQNVVLANGNSVDYDHLVLATGGHNRLLSIPGDDADALSPRMSAASNVVVVGCGFIGLEFAAVAAALGKSVQLVDRGDRLMARAISHEMSALFLDAHQGWGVKFHFNQGVSRITHANGKLSGVVKENGEELPADLLPVHTQQRRTHPHRIRAQRYGSGP